MLWEVCLTYLLDCCVAGLWGRCCLPWTTWATSISVNRVIVIWTITILKCGNILQYYSFPSGTHGTGQVPDHHIFQIIIEYLYQLKFLHVIFRYCLQSMCTCQLFSFYHKKDSAFSIIIGPFVGFPSECLSADHWFNTLSSCANFGFFSVHLLKGYFTPLLDAVNYCNCSSQFFIYIYIYIYRERERNALG